MKPTLNINNITKLLFSIAILFISLNGSSQVFKEGNVKSLVKLNGFKGIILGSDISDVMMHYNLSYLDDNSSKDLDSCITYGCKDSTLLAMPGKLALNMVGIRTYHHKIINIYLFFNIKNSDEILGDFLKQYGQFNSLPYEYTNIYDWNTPKVNLSLRYAAKAEMGLAVYSCNSLIAEVANYHKLQQRLRAEYTENYLASRGVYANDNQK